MLILAIGLASTLVALGEIVGLLQLDPQPLAR